MSKIRDAWLLAGASSVALTGAAGAQSRPPAPGVTTSWAGFYAGINLGQARHHATTTDVNNYSGIPPNNYVTTWFDSTKTSFTYGGQVGYNWQYKMLVVGVEADINQVGAETTFAPVNNFAALGCNSTCAASATNELKWLATFRGRAGIAIQQFFFYGTAGLAVGRVSNRWGFGDSASFSDSQFSVDETRVGVVYGGGAELALSPHWTVRAEGLYVDLGTSSSTNNTINPVAAILTPGTPPFRTDFKNTATIGRLALNYKW